MFDEFAKFVVEVDIIFSVILVAIQSLINTQFTCPCQSNNIFFYDALLSCSSLIIIFITLLILNHKLRRDKRHWDSIVSCNNARRIIHTQFSENSRKGCIKFWKYFCREACNGCTNCCRSGLGCLKCCFGCPFCSGNACSVFWSSVSKLCYFLGICLSLLLPVLMWVIMWYFDGDLYVCGMSSWNGTWEQTSANVYIHWCRPPDNETFDEQKRESMEWFFISQEFSLKLLCGLIGCMIAYSFFLIYVSVTTMEEENHNDGSEEMAD